MKPSLPGFKNAWCICEAGFIGRFCDLTGNMMQPPSDRVDVEMKVTVLRLGGLSTDGTHFYVDLEVALTWTDKRIPWDDGTYFESDAKALETDAWLPRIIFSGIPPDVSGDSKLQISRNTTEEEQKMQSLEVRLTRTIIRQVEQRMAPNFEDFPFDKHKLEFSITGMADTSITLQEGNILVTDEVMDHWNDQWPPDGSDQDWAKVTPTKANSFEVRLAVKRAANLIVFRLVLPMSLLVMMSWSAFFINPKMLMPRFASGFISFLSLQVFRGQAVNQMPNEGHINAMSWIDVYLVFVD
jgi:hypothetical protein